MDDFTAILQQDFGLKPQGKSAPMAAVKTVGISNSGSSRRGKSFEVSSILSSKSSASSLPPDALEDDLLFAGNGTNISGTGSWLGSAEPFVYDDVFGGPPKFPTSTSKSPFMQNYDDISPKSKTSFHKASSLPVFDAPVFDDDIFGGVPGVRKISVAYEDVFSSGLATASSAAAFTDFSGGYAAMETKIGYGARETNLRYGATGIKAGDGATGTKAGYGTKTAKARYIATEMKARDDSTDTKVGSNATDMKVGSRTTERKVGFGVTDNKAKKSSRSSSEHPSTIDFGASDMAYDEQACKSLTHETRKNVFEFWITVDDVKLVTQPCSAAPPARSPPVCGLKSNKEEANEDVTLDFSTYFVQKRSDSTYQTGIDSPIKSTVNNSSSLIEELEEFASGGLKTLKGANVDTASCSASDEEQTDESATAAASSAAMKHAMERAEARLKRVKEARDREREETAKLVTEGEQGRKARERKGRQCASESEGKAHETGETERELMAHETEECEEREQMVQEEGQEHAACEAQEQEERNRLAREAHEKKEREGAACERDERERAACGIHEREEKERKVKERRRKDREKKKERERDRIAVERATQDARGRAEAKAVAEAREKAERAAVERATAEARGRAAVEASERAAVKRAAAEARARTERAGVERANAEARERAAERAAVERAAAEAQERAERAAVECVTAEKVAAAREQKQKYENDLDAFFMGASRTSSEPRQRSATSEVPSATAQTSRGVQNGGERVFTGTTAGVRKVASVMTDDFTSLFNPTTNDFPNVDGETLERRRARLERYQRTHERAAKALEEKNQRDLQCQREQAERHRASEMLDLEIKRWATGKEGNLRALLSTLQYVLWPECGWQPVSLIDLITSAAVKKVYRKATLCVHPDKVQQKGATIRQKYIAEKVFDLLKEAWNKFNSEELF